MNRALALALMVVVGLAIGILFGWLMVHVWRLSHTLFWVLALAGLAAEALNLLLRRRRVT